MQKSEWSNPERHCQGLFLLLLSTLDKCFFRLDCRFSYKNSFLTFRNKDERLFQTKTANCPFEGDFCPYFALSIMVVCFTE